VNTVPLLLAAGALAACVASMRLRLDPLVALGATVRRRREQAEARAALGTAARRLAAEVGAGRTIESALRSAAGAAPPSLTLALAQAARDLEDGREPGPALAACLGDEAPARMFGASLALARRSGGDLAELLRGLARSLDERARVEADVRAQTAQARFSALIVPLLPVLALVGLAMLDPAGIEALLTTGMGRAVLCVAFVLDLVGLLVIRQVTQGIE